ncbi:MAG: hypothetical protein AB7K04_17500 [Pseudorhodoplanes sp.]
MLIPNARFLVLPMVALAVITVLGLQGQRSVAAPAEVSAAPVLQQMAHAAKNTFVR